MLSPVQLFVTPWTAAHQAPVSMGFSRQEYWSRLPFPSPGDIPDPGIEPWSPALQTDSLPSEPQCVFSINLRKDYKMLKIRIFFRLSRLTWSGSPVTAWLTLQSGKGASWSTRWATWPALLEACLHWGQMMLLKEWPNTTFSSGLKLPGPVTNLTIAPVSPCYSSYVIFVLFISFIKYFVHLLPSKEHPLCLMNVWWLWLIS